MFRIMTSKAHGNRQVAVAKDLKTAHARALAGSPADCPCGGCLWVDDGSGRALDPADLDDESLEEVRELADALREAWEDRP